jgi:AraC family transcriptional regulator
MFFYLISAGQFFCDENYLVKRDNFNSFLLMYVKDGHGNVCFHNKTYNLKTNDLVLLNCYHPHIYYTTKKWEIWWVHFDGNVSRQYWELLYDRFGCVFSLEDSPIIPKYLSTILNTFKESKIPDEPMVSCYFQRILTELLSISSKTGKQRPNRVNPVMDAVTYIENNYRTKISLRDLSAQVNTSPYHFTRIFKKETGYTPYEYIIKVRINHAKTLLKKTDLLIKEIAFEVGFSSESNFVNSFRSHVNLTPNDFRKTPF